MIYFNPEVVFFLNSNYINVLKEIPLSLSFIKHDR